MPDQSALPNALSLSRVPMGLALVVLYNPNEIILLSISVLIIFLALLSDVLDGKIARARKVDSRKGYILDGLGDKAFYIAFYIVILREMPGVAILCWFLILREIALYGLRTLTSNPDTQLSSLRPFSLAHALFVRIWFAIFVLSDILNLVGWGWSPMNSFGIVFGIIAALSGGIGIYLQIKHQLET